MWRPFPAPPPEREKNFGREFLRNRVVVNRGVGEVGEAGEVRAEESIKRFGIAGANPGNYRSVCCGEWTRGGGGRVR